MITRYFIVPDVRTWSAEIKESSNITYVCPQNTVLTGRWHSGDEKGKTRYEYATLKVIDNDGNNVSGTFNITVEDVEWTDGISESEGKGFTAPIDRVLVGRRHNGDENGQTYYATAVVKLNGVVAKTTDSVVSGRITESSGYWFSTAARRVMVGRIHKGDENAKTVYVSSALEIIYGEAQPAPEGTIIGPSTRNVSNVYNTADSQFICPFNTVMTGVKHVGDENGTTQYQYATLRAVDSQGNPVQGYISVRIVAWYVAANTGKNYDAPYGYVIVGRYHFGNQDGMSLYGIGQVLFNYHPTYINYKTVSEPVVESSGTWVVSGIDEVITSHHHYGNAYGYTYYDFSEIVCEEPVQTQFPFDLVIALHPNERYYPMSATDYASLSRFRKHVSNNDYGYNKNIDDFVQGDSHSTEYYKIPLSIINGYKSNIPNKLLYNLRPYDHLSLGGDKYFLQPFARLKGIKDLNRRVPAYTHTLEYFQTDGTRFTLIDFWLFFGFNETATMLDFSHQGDWEHVMVKLVNNVIVGAWLSQHDGFKYHSATDLQITNVNGRQVLKVYCADGTHALYKAAGTYSRPFAGTSDHAADGGDEWKITDCCETLVTQPWKDFAGAWGEIGNSKHTTGPLGPWYKRFNFWYMEESNPADIIPHGTIAFVPDQYYLSEEHSESEGYSFEAPENMVMVGRKHSGDENGKTFCLYASLKAVDYLGRNIANPGQITLANVHWEGPIIESSSTFNAPAGYVILGRRHVGDENGQTYYKVARILYNGNSTTVVSQFTNMLNQRYVESGGVFFKVSPYLLYIGRVHSGDENGVTYNIQGLVYYNTFI